MTLPELRERVDRLISGGVFSDENRLDTGYVDAIIHDARAFVLRQDFIKNKRWSPQAQQDYYPLFDTYYQDSTCYTRFKLPTSFIQATGAQDGLIYCGSSSNKIHTTRAFRRIKSRTELSDMLQHSIMSPANGTYVAVLMEGLQATIISKERIKEPMLTAVFDNPTALEDYNIDVDEYPLSQDMITQLEVHLTQTVLQTVFSKQPDGISNSSEDSPTPLRKTK